MSYRELMMAGALALGSCGGLAADGPSGDIGDCMDDGCASGSSPNVEGPLFPDVESSASAAQLPGALDRDDSSVHAEAGGSAGSSSAPRVGESCGPGSNPGARLTIGEIVLDGSGS
ncbi:MAG TPA: hypothetical protein VMG12_24255, partial [Polyangiaceae bacterium]|nr:hypothetical protein [Polyangiaceae bacterium]